MFLKHKLNGQLVEVLTLEHMYDPCLKEVTGRMHAGQEMQEPETFMKSELIFPSGEPLPICWLNPHYQEDSFHQKSTAAVG